jgi:DNA primase
MEIQEIKQRLTLAEVIKHYGFKADKHNRICCPFHDDKTPSLQLYYKTHTAYCFSGSCPTHGHSMDVIEIVQRMEKTDKHQAILKCVELLHSGDTEILATELTRTAVLTRMFTYFKNAVYNSKPAQEYLQSRCLDHKQTEVGYNAGQFHHGTRKEEALIKSCMEVGLLQDIGNKSRTGEIAYHVFGKWCIVFALKDKDNHVAGLYFRSTLNDKEQRHFYLKDRQGLYPHYPKADTKRLLLTESIIDAATLLQIPAIAEQYSILALYGTNGLTPERHRILTTA